MFAAMWAFLAGAAAVAAVPGTDSPPGELLRNRSFELGSPGGAPTNWGVNSFRTESVAGVDATVARTGNQSLRIEGRDSKGRAGATASFRGDVVNPDYLYRFSAWVRIEKPSKDPNRTSIRFTSVKGESDVLRSDYRVCESGPHDWKRYEWDVKLAPGTEWFNIVLFHHGEGTIWWDDVSLKVLRTVETRAPARGALVPDGRPAFEWAAPLTGMLEIAPDGDFESQEIRRISVSGTRHALEESLPAGRFYGWRVVAETPSGQVVTMPAGSKEGESAYARFYVGSADQMKEDVMKK